MGNKKANLTLFNTLNRRDVITAEISDHHPLIHDRCLFWNIMMQGKSRWSAKGMSYNNGFGKIETDEAYCYRLQRIAAIIAEIIYMHPSIDIVTLCEGPVKLSDREIFYSSLRKYKPMNKFFSETSMDQNLHGQNKDEFPDWGLVMLTNQDYHVKQIEMDLKIQSGIYKKIVNRFKLWELSGVDGGKKYVALAHLPFCGNEHVTDVNNLSSEGDIYRDFIGKLLLTYSQELLTLCADFNFNPYLISRWQDRVLDMIPGHNSILFEKQKVTVDGILLSTLAKQRFSRTLSHVGLFKRLKNEECLSLEINKKYLINNRHQGPAIQEAYDKQFGLMKLQ